MLPLLAFWVCFLALAKGEFAVTLNQTDVKFLRNSTQNYFYSVARYAAIDEKNNLIYSAGTHQVDVLRYKENMELEVLYTGTYTKTIMSIQVCDGLMSAVVQQRRQGTYRIDTSLELFPTFNGSLNYVLQPIKSIPVSGRWAKQHVITRDCKKYIIALQGTVGIISFAGTDGPNDQVAFEEKYIPIVGINNLDDIKKTYLSSHEIPTYSLTRISINADETRAYVSDVVHNAIVTIDLLQGTVINITGMGAKDWSKDGGTHGLDCSDDGVINITNVPLLTYNQPFGIQSVRLGNDDILFTGNSGYMGNAIPIRTATFDNGSSHLQDIRNACPNIYIEYYSIHNDADDNKKMNKAMGFGGRGLSLFNATDFQIIAETKSAVEESIRDIHPQWFNKVFSLYRSPINLVPTLGPALRSTVAAFVCNNQRLVTIAGGDLLYVFTVDVNRIDQGFHFHGLYDGVTNRSSNSTFRQLYDDRLVSLKAISSLQIVEVAPEKLMLVAAGYVTGTINVFEILVTDCPTNNEINIEEDSDGGPRCSRKNKNKKKGSNKNKNKKKCSKNSSSSEDDDEGSSKGSSKNKDKRKGSKKSGSSEDDSK